MSSKMNIVTAVYNVFEKKLEEAEKKLEEAEKKLEEAEKKIAELEKEKESHCVSCLKCDKKMFDEEFYFEQADEDDIGFYLCIQCYHSL